MGRLQRRMNAAALVYRRLATIVAVLLAAGYIWMVLIPIPPLSQGVYIDENALQPGQVNTNWNWQDVHLADMYLRHLEHLRDQNATSEQRAIFIRDEFAKLRLAAAIQNYTFISPSGNVSGVNAYALMNAPRASGSEAIVISASWRSEVGEEQYNLRGIATVIALASFLKNYSLWAKDIIFVVGDNYLDGTYAWLSAYHGTIPHNLDTDLLQLTSGVIWNAFNIDYSGHSFSHLGVFFEGLNGRLPNQDLINSVRLISHYTGGVPLVLYDHLETHEAPQRSLLANAPEFIQRSPQLRDLEYRARNVRRHIGYQARGQPSGPHGLFHRFRIDAITLYAVPADGPHGFFALGRIIESTLRTSNNLLERLHASFFFYILTTPGTFMKIGMFLPSAVLVGVAMLFWGLGRWVEAGCVQASPLQAQRQESDRVVDTTGMAQESLEMQHNDKDEKDDSKVADAAGLVRESLCEVQDEDEKDDHKVAKAADVTASTTKPIWRPRRRPVLPVIVTMAVTHLLGLLAFVVINTSWFFENQVISARMLFLAFGSVPHILLASIPSHPPGTAPFSLLLHSFNLCLASTVISITSILNFSLAATLAVTLSVPLICSRSAFRFSVTSTSFFNDLSRSLVYSEYWLLAWGWLLWTDEVERAVWNWQVLGVWFAPFVCIVYAPLVMQAGLVALSRP